ncbi:MAG TPA: acyl carrier protein [Candidatus Eisenbacteria bacterium]|nr:acyl carrier protein [Candidatus Eisenbacteria bacterium]
MSRDEIREKVLSILSRFAERTGKKVKLSESTKLDELEINSAQMIDIVLDLEDEFGVSIDDTETPKLRTVSDLVTLADKLVNS